MSETQKAERERLKAEAILKLREMLPPGSTVKTILRHVSRSGMMRSISPMIDGEDYSWLVGRALDMRFDQKNGGLRIGGCGMDMGFALVYNLSQVLYPKGFSCIGEDGPLGRCPSNDHSNGDRDYTPHMHGSGGYALRHRWL